MKFSFTGIFIASLFILGVVFSSSCKKQQFLTTGGELQFSTDTLSFDTVFTAVASFTLNVKIKNPQGQKVTISSVRLEKGNNSYFNLNVNGFPGNNIKDLEVAANDSIYVYATVNIDPNDDNTPFIIQDKLIATMNGKEFSIPMYAYGQNAYYITDSTITQNDTWRKDKPYVIVRGVAIDTNVTLTIPAGARIYMNADTRMFVLGKLIAKGTKTDSIIFQGDRLDRGYFGGVGYPGEWGGIYFFETSKGNEMDWCILKNCGNNAFGTLAAAIQVTGDNNTGTDTQLTITHSIIANSIGYGIIAFQGNVSMENCLVHSTGAQALAIFQGGNYRITNCDFINYFPARVSHTDNPTAAILNYYDIDDTRYVAADLHAVLTNCLIYGSLEEEIVSLSKGNKVFDVRIDHCLLKTSGKTTVLSPDIQFNVSDSNKDPNFKDYKKEDFRAKSSSSPLVDKGAGSTKSNRDLDDNNRTNGVIDIGCYEF